jgi:hypothetical protein
VNEGLRPLKGYDVVLKYDSENETTRIYPKSDRAYEYFNMHKEGGVFTLFKPIKDVIDLFNKSDLTFKIEE